MSNSTFRFACYEFESPCSYFPDKTSRIRLCDPDTADAASYDILIQNGYRRDGTAQYCPVCVGCDACKSVRVRVAEFVPDRTQRKLMRRNGDLLVRIVPPALVPEHFELFQTYEKTRHGGPMSEMTVQDFERHLLGTSANTFLLEFRLKEDQRLVALAILDQVHDGLSAVYTVYDPHMRSLSLGTFCILYEVELTKRLGLPYLYLGYWLEGFDRMDYKRRFQPLEVFHTSQWLEFDTYKNQHS